MSRNLNWSRRGNVESLTTPHRLVRRSGERYWAEGTLTAIHDNAGTLTGFAKIVRGSSERKRMQEALRYKRGAAAHRLTERKQADNRLRETEERLRLFVNNVRDYALFQMDNEGRVIAWNAGAERVLGYAEEEIIGQSAEQIFVPEDIAAGIPQQK